MDVTAARLRGHQLQPTGSNQTVEQGAYLFGIKPTAERLTPDVQQRYLWLPVCPNPAQCATGVGVLFGQPNLPERRPTVRPEIISPQPHRRCDVLLVNGPRLGAAEHCPVQVNQRAAQSQDMGAALGNPFPFSAIQLCLCLCQKGPKGLKGRGALDKSTVLGAKTPSSSAGRSTMRVRAF